MVDSVGVDTVSASAVAALAELTGLWTDIGYSKDDILTETRKLDNSLRKLSDDILQQHEYNVQMLRQQLAELTHLADNIRSQLDYPLQSPNQLTHSNSLLQNIELAQAQLQQLNALKEARIEEFSNVFADLHDLYEKLGDKLPVGLEEIGQDLSAQKLHEIVAKMKDAEAEIEIRKARVVALVREIVELFVLLAYTEEDLQQEPFDWKIYDLSVRAKISEDELLGDSVIEDWDDEISFLLLDFVPTNVLQSLEERRSQLVAESESRRDQLKRLALHITELWDRLNVSHTERQQFFGEHCGLGRDTLDACEIELRRLQDLKKARLKDLIHLAKSQLEDLWVKCHISPAEQNAMSQPKDLFTDEILDLYETEIVRLEKRYEDMKPLLDLWDKRENILHEKAEYEKRCQDPDRFKKRFALLQEEQARKHIAKLPKITETLYQQVKQWEIQHKTHFTINGQRVVEVLELSMREEAEKKQNKKPGRSATQNSPSRINLQSTMSSTMKKNQLQNMLQDQNQKNAQNNSLRRPRRA